MKIKSKVEKLSENRDKKKVMLIIFSLFYVQTIFSYIIKSFPNLLINLETIVLKFNKHFNESLYFFLTVKIK